MDFSKYIFTKIDNFYCFYLILVIIYLLKKVDIS